MILKRLVLHNVGTFAGRNAIELTPPSDDKPIVLIGGLNGAGKTTVLEAIQLALYGQLAQPTGRRGGGSYDRYLKSLVHRGVPLSEGAGVELEFVAHQEGEERTYWIQRTWSASGKLVTPRMNVFVDGTYDKALTDTWSEHVETFLPRGIAGLFFFDGEQIEALADLERSRQVLGSALAALLGLDLVDRLATDLTVLKRRHKGERVPESLRAAIEQKKTALTALQQVAQADGVALAVRKAELERCQKVFFTATMAYRQAGGEMLDERETAESASKHLRESLVVCEEAIRHELSETSPLLQLGALIEQATQHAVLEDEGQRNRVIVQSFLSHNDALLAKLKAHKVEGQTLSAIQQFLDEDIIERRSSSNVEEVVGSVDVAAIQALSTSTLPEAYVRLSALVRERTMLRADMVQAERVLAAVPDADALAPLHAMREEARTVLLRAEAAVELSTERLEATRAERDKASAVYESAVDKAAEANLAADDDRRLLEHLDRVQGTLAALKIEATQRHLDRISALIMEALTMLMRKVSLITDVQIDPQTFAVALTGADNQPLEASALSAGERQLLAVALLWGLARAAGQPLPVVIDTPLGRLDGTHREHLLDRYFPHASHQVIMLSTDTEIDRSAYERIADKVGIAYRLEFDRSSNATTVQPGYFWE